MAIYGIPDIIPANTGLNFTIQQLQSWRHSHKACLWRAQCVWTVITVSGCVLSACQRQQRLSAGAACCALKMLNEWPLKKKPSPQPSQQFIHSKNNNNLTFSFGSRDTHLILWSSFDVSICILCLSSYWTEETFADRITCYTLWRWHISLSPYIWILYVSLSSSCDGVGGSVRV